MLKINIDCDKIRQDVKRYLGIENETDESLFDVTNDKDQWAFMYNECHGLWESIGCQVFMSAILKEDELDVGRIVSDFIKEDNCKAAARLATSDKFDDEYREIVRNDSPCWILYDFMKRKNEFFKKTLEEMRAKRDNG